MMTTSDASLAAMPAAVTLVIPGRNCERTLSACLDAVTRLLAAGELSEIVFVDDGSTDATRAIAGRYPVRILEGGGVGPGAARNLGWRAARTELVWFIDSDCVAEPDALQRLCACVSEPDVGGAGGSYANLRPDSTLACLIHEEIASRHRNMGDDVDFLGGFNVLYRRAALEAVEGFDECEVNGPGAPGAEDCDLSFRLVQAGWRLKFDRQSRVGHFHPTSLRRYLRSQYLHGRFRVRLYFRHSGKMAGDDYSGLADHLQPPLALATLLLLPWIWAPYVPLLAGVGLAATTACSLPRCTTLSALPWKTWIWFPLVSSLRAAARGAGIVSGFLPRASSAR
ncbi:MAG: glycosyltransferase [Pirellulales bacterium]